MIAAAAPSYDGPESVCWADQATFGSTGSVEIGSTEAIFAPPFHPYTLSLLLAVPVKPPLEVFGADAQPAVDVHPR